MVYIYMVYIYMVYIYMVYIYMVYIYMVYIYMVYIYDCMCLYHHTCESTSFGGIHTIMLMHHYQGMYKTTMPYDPEGILGTLTTIFMCYLGLQVSMD